MENIANDIVLGTPALGADPIDGLVIFIFIFLIL